MANNGNGNGHPIHIVAIASGGVPVLDTEGRVATYATRDWARQHAGPLGVAAAIGHDALIAHYCRPLGIQPPALPEPVQGALW